MKEDTLVPSYFLEDGGIRYRGAFMVREQPAVGGAAVYRRIYPVTFSLEMSRNPLSPCTAQSLYSGFLFWSGGSILIAILTEFFGVI